MKAFLKNYRQAPRKVRLIANEVRGKNVAQILNTLSLMSNKSAPALSKLIASAYANAHQADASLKKEDLFVSSITVDKGTTFTRFMPRARGQASPIHRECSHIAVTLDRI
jgi:large subunit ribosomal protein L22